MKKTQAMTCMPGNPSSVGGDNGIPASVGVAPAAGDDSIHRRRPP
jgi:hypothetical protein